MSQILRAAVAATSLFSFPACATTGSFDQTLTKTEEAGTNDFAGRCLAPSSEHPSPRWWQPALNAAPTNQTAAVLAWEQEQAYSAPGVSGGFSKVFEPTNSRIRLVLNMPNPNNTSSASDSTVAQTAFHSVSPWLGRAELLPSSLGAGFAEVFAPNPDRNPLAAFIEAPTTTHNTPEPGALALTALGVAALGVRRLRRSVA